MSVRSIALAASRITPGISSLLHPDSLQHPRRCAQETLPSASAELNAMLKGGFPKRSLTEILTLENAAGELSLVLPAVAALGRAFWMLPNVSAFEPCAPALEASGLVLTEQLFATAPSAEEAFWASERVAAEGAFGAVVAWLKPLGAQDDMHAMRRLALAARTSGTTVFAIRPLNLCGSPSAAHLRVTMSPRPDGLTDLRTHRPENIFSRTRHAVVSLDFGRSQREAA